MCESVIQCAVSLISILFSNFQESVPNLEIEDMLDDFVTFFVAGKTLRM